METNINNKMDPTKYEPSLNTEQKGPKGKSNGAMIGTIIIILILIIGGIYLLGRIYGEKIEENETTQINNIENETYYLEGYENSDSLSESDDLESIEADLQSQSDMEFDTEI